MRNFELNTPIVSQSMEMKQLDSRDLVLKPVILRLMPKQPDEMRNLDLENLIVKRILEMKKPSKRS